MVINIHSPESFRDCFENRPDKLASDLADHLLDHVDLEEELLYPKKVNLEGLSRRLKVSYVTLAEILRRAEKNIISSYFKKKEE